MNRLDRHGFAALLAWLLCSVAYLWTAQTIALEPERLGNLSHHYEYLVDGFLSGHLHLSVAPAKELLALPNPWDPALNDRYRLGDASLFDGKYYLYFGPTPALLLMLPWKALTGSQLPQWLACGLFASAGLAALALLLSGLRRRYFPSVTPTQLFFSVVVIGQVSWLPVVLRRSAFWELPIITAAALLWWSLYWLWKYHDSGGRTRWAVIAGVTLAFLLGARPTYLFTAGVMTLLFALPLERGLPLSHYVRRLLPVILPLLVGGLGLLAYNYLRFGQPLEFGQHYQLWGDGTSASKFFGAAHFPFNFWLYFFSLPEFSPYFPFFHPVWIGRLPANYNNVEDLHGLLFALPVQLLGFAAWLIFEKRRREPLLRPLGLVLLAATAASVLAGSIIFFQTGSCSRYITELVAGWSVVTGIGLLAVFSRPTNTWRGPLLRLAAGAAALWSLAYVWLASIEYRDLTRTSRPAFYRALEHALNYPSYWAIQQSGRTFGPLALEVHLAASDPGHSVVLLATGQPGTMNRLVLESIAPAQWRLRLVMNNLIMLETPVFHHEGTELHVECHAPWLYPPANHPYWQTAQNAGEATRRQTLLGLKVDDQWVSRQAVRIFDASGFEPSVHTSAAPPDFAWVEKISRLEFAPPGARP